MIIAVRLRASAAANRTPLIMGAAYRDQTSVTAPNQPQITTAPPLFVLPLLPPEAGSTGSTQGSGKSLNGRQRAPSIIADLRHLE
jgi:hypothetical protein